MKKTILTIIAAISAMSSVWAIEDAAMTVTLQSTNARYNVVSLEQGVLYTNEKNTTDIYANITNTTTAVNIYAIASYGNMSIMTTNNLDGVYLGITTNSCTDDYTLTFTGVSGAQLFLVDHETNEIKPIVENLVHTFDAPALSTIEDRFQIVNLTSLTTNAYGWASYSNDADVIATVPTGLKIYTGAVNGEYLDLTQVDYVKANEGVVVYGTPNTTYYFAAGTGASVYGTNHLKPTSAFDPANYSNVYVLKGEELLEYTGTVALAANKAYLQLPANNPAPASRRISFRFEETTGVENTVAPAKVEKFVEDGQVLIKRGEAVYNLQGQMVR